MGYGKYVKQTTAAQPGNRNRRLDHRHRSVPSLELEVAARRVGNSGEKSGDVLIWSSEWQLFAAHVFGGGGGGR